MVYKLVAKWWQVALQTCRSFVVFLLRENIPQVHRKHHIYLPTTNVRPNTGGHFVTCGTTVESCLVEAPIILSLWKGCTGRFVINRVVALVAGCAGCSIFLTGFMKTLCASCAGSIQSIQQPMRICTGMPLIIMSSWDSIRFPNGSKQHRVNIFNIGHTRHYTVNFHILHTLCLVLHLFCFVSVLSSFCLLFFVQSFFVIRYYLYVTPPREYVVCFPFRMMVFFYLVTTCWNFVTMAYLCDYSINQPKKQR